jgi:hypothetical protein
MRYKQSILLRCLWFSPINFSSVNVPQIILFTTFIEVCDSSLILLLQFSHENGTAHIEKCKQLLEWQNLHLLCDIWLLKFKHIFNCCLFFQCQFLDICSSLRQLFSSIGVYYVLPYYMQLSKEEIF